ncbi:MAG TPA: FUSC family protein, partial [Candidatus Acidoferrum sp.]|nr:FUSC family protein [Candidatus Acidoferrum sp.]
MIALRDRLLASDPPLERLRLALRATIAVLLAGGLNALLVHAGIMTGTAGVLGALIGLWSSFVVNDPNPRRRQVTTLLVPLPAAVSASLMSLAEAASHALGGLTFLTIAFVGIWVRRFGPRATGLGMIALFAAFFTLFIGVPPAALPGAYLAFIVGTLAGYVAHFVLVTDSPHLALRAARTAWRARVRVVARVAEKTLRGDELGPPQHLREEISAFNRAALPIDDLLTGDAFALDEPARRRCRVLLLDAELAAERCVAEVIAHRADAQAPPIADAFAALARNDLKATRERAQRFAAHPLAAALIAALSAFEDFRNGIEVAVRAPETGRADAPLSPAPQPPQIGPIKPTTLLAIHVTVASALAMLFGSIVPPHRYLWAVVTAFLVYNGTASAGETRERSWTRTTGTIVGVALGFVLVEVVRDRPIVEAVLGLVCLTLALYTFRFSYALFNFFL